MKYFARLIQGITYTVGNTGFKIGDAFKSVSRELYDYLGENPQFETKEVDDCDGPPKVPNTKKSVGGPINLSDIGTAIADTPHAKAIVERAKAETKSKKGLKR